MIYIFGIIYIFKKKNKKIKCINEKFCIISVNVNKKKKKRQMKRWS